MKLLALLMGSGHFVNEAEEMYLQKLYEFWEIDNEKSVRTSGFCCISKIDM